MLIFHPRQVYALEIIKVLVNVAHSAVRNQKSYFYAQFLRIRSHRGKKRAYDAVAHSMLVAIYHILKDGIKFRTWELIIIPSLIETDWISL